MPKEGISRPQTCNCKVADGLLRQDFSAANQFTMLHLMASILIAYDLIGTDESSEDYRRLIEHIKEDYSNWAKVLYSTFIVKTSQSVVEVRDNLNRYTDRNDRLFVVDITGKGAAWRNVICSDDWLQRNI